MGVNFKVTDDRGGAGQYSPAISVDGEGKFVVVWEDYRNGGRDIYAQRFISSGGALGQKFVVTMVRKKCSILRM